MLLQGPRGCAPHHLPFADDLGCKNATPGAQHCAGFNARFVAYADLPTDDRMVFDDDSAGEPSLSGNDHSSSDAAIVRDVDQVVELGAIADLRDSQSCAVDA
jgi:hypothetical protein